MLVLVICNQEEQNLPWKKYSDWQFEYCPFLQSAFLEIQEKINRPTALLWTMSTFYARLMLYHIILYINNEPCMLFTGIIIFTACC